VVAHRSPRGPQPWRAIGTELAAAEPPRPDIGSGDGDHGPAAISACTRRNLCQRSIKVRGRSWSAPISATNPARSRCSAGTSSRSQGGTIAPSVRSTPSKTASKPSGFHAGTRRSARQSLAAPRPDTAPTLTTDPGPPARPPSAAWRRGRSHPRRRGWRAARPVPARRGRRRRDDRRFTHRAHHKRSSRRGRHRARNITT
jgi:hypothetical protein